jgi:hypothetical protein
MFLGQCIIESMNKDAFCDVNNTFEYEYLHYGVVCTE